MSNVKDTKRRKSRFHFDKIFIIFYHYAVKYNCFLFKSMYFLFLLFYLWTSRDINRTYIPFTVVEICNTILDNEQMNDESWVCDTVIECGNINNEIKCKSKWGEWHKEHNVNIVMVSKEIREIKVSLNKNMNVTKKQGKCFNKSKMTSATQKHSHNIW